MTLMAINFNGLSHHAIIIILENQLFKLKSKDQTSLLFRLIKFFLFNEIISNFNTIDLITLCIFYESGLKFIYILVILSDKY